MKYFLASRTSDYANFVSLAVSMLLAQQLVAQTCQPPTIVGSVGSVLRMMANPGNVSGGRLARLKRTPAIQVLIRNFEPMINERITGHLLFCRP